MKAQKTRLIDTLGLALALFTLAACAPGSLTTASEAQDPRVTAVSTEAPLIISTPTPRDRPTATLEPTATAAVRMDPLDLRDATVTPVATAQSQDLAEANTVSASVAPDNQSTENVIVVNQQSSSATAQTGAATGSANAHDAGKTSTSQSQVNVNISSSSSASGGQTNSQTIIRSSDSSNSVTTEDVPPRLQPFPTMQTEGNPSGGQAADQKVYQLCGQDDSGMARAIEQFVAGRGFSAQLISHSGACPNLTITIPTGSASGTAHGSQQTHLSVTSGGRNFQIDIVSENGITRASVGSGA